VRSIKRSAAQIGVRSNQQDLIQEMEPQRRLPYKFAKHVRGELNGDGRIVRSGANYGEIDWCFQKQFANHDLLHRQIRAQSLASGVALGRTV
jgi:hypothetical protein